MLIIRSGGRTAQSWPLVTMNRGLSLARRLQVTGKRSSGPHGVPPAEIPTDYPKSCP